MIKIIDCPNVPNCGVCQVRLSKDYSSLEAGRESVRGKKMVMLNCRPVAEVTFCVEHAKERVGKIKEYIDRQVQMVLDL